MANKRRGEVSFEVEGETYTLCMNLNAMAELEESFGLDSISQLGEVFVDGQFKIRQLIWLLGALIRGGGHDITDKEIGDWGLDTVEAFSKAMDAINIQGDPAPPGKQKTTGKRTKKM